MTVYLVRHGETDAARHGLYGRSPGIALSEAGKAEAHRVADHLKSRPVVAIYSSPLERTMETAAPIAEALRLNVQQCAAFIEVDQGDWTGVAWQELHKNPDWRLYNTYRSGTSCPNGEMAIEIQARAVRTLNQLLELHSDQQIVMVSHADVIRAAICHYAGIPIDFSLRIEISPGSVSTLQLHRDGARIIELNRTF